MALLKNIFGRSSRFGELEDGQGKPSPADEAAATALRREHRQMLYAMITEACTKADVTAQVDKCKAISPGGQAFIVLIYMRNLPSRARASFMPRFELLQEELSLMATRRGIPLDGIFFGFPLHELAPHEMSDDALSGFAHSTVADLFERESEFGNIEFPKVDGVPPR